MALVGRERVEARRAPRRAWGSMVLARCMVLFVLIGATPARGTAAAPRSLVAAAPAAATTPNKAKVKRKRAKPTPPPEAPPVAVPAPVAEPPPTPLPAPASSDAPLAPLAPPAADVAPPPHPVAEPPPASVASPGASTAPVAPARATPVAGGDREEEVVDFKAEERRSETESQRVKAEAATGGLGALGLKLVVDLLVEHTIGEEKFQFRPHHTYVIVMGQPVDDLQFMVQLSDNPLFYEVSWAVTPRISITAGKLLIPFGTSEFHQLIGGRVDEHGAFLPELWADYGLALRHHLVDSEAVSTDYALYVVNGFQGTDAPNIASGSGTDNNWAKGVGARVRVTALRTVTVTGSAYYDRWDVRGKESVLYYSLGGELRGALFGLPRLRLRGEWSRGEIGVAGRDYQRGITRFAVARSGTYAEAQYAFTERFAVRLRGGRLNPDNTVADASDTEVYEPALLIGVGSKVWWTLAYQLLTGPGLDRKAPGHADVVYAKFFLQL